MATGPPEARYRPTVLTWMHTLRGRIVGALGVGVLGFLGGLGWHDLQLRRIGAALRVVDEAYLPLARLSVEITARADTGPDGALAEARRIAAETLATTTDEEERAALQAALSQVAAVEAVVGRPGVTPAEVRAEVQKLARLVDARIAAVSVRTAQAQGRAERISGALMALAVALGAALLWVTGSALRPITALTSQVERVAAGESAGPLVVAGHDEIATLALAFAQMTAAVEERDQSLQALSLYLRRVLDSLGSAVVVVEGSAVRMANPAARALWGLAEGDRLPAALDALAEGRHVEIPGAEGRVQDVAVRPFGESGRVLVGDDATDRARARERLARSERLALVGQMLAQVTHEVRNPLNAMSLHAELLAEELPAEGEARALLATMVAEIGRLEGVTERYLDLARRRAPDLSPEDPLALARAVVALEEEGLRRNGIGVRVEGVPDGLVELDGNALRRALHNLVRNAAEAGAKQISVAVLRPPGALEITVGDDGPGMPEDVSGRIFDPFFTTRAKGTGLGLAITRQIIEDLGGTIRCETHPGEGTRFVLRLPA